MILDVNERRSVIHTKKCFVQIVVELNRWSRNLVAQGVSLLTGINYISVEFRHR